METASLQVSLWRRRISFPIRLKRLENAESVELSLVYLEIRHGSVMISIILQANSGLGRCFGLFGNKTRVQLSEPDRKQRRVCCHLSRKMKMLPGGNSETFKTLYLIRQTNMYDYVRL